MANLFLTGSGVPTNAVGEVTDYYRDTATNLIYYRAALGWEVVPSLVPTPDGVGTHWFYGNGTPSNGIGSANDYYRDDANGSVYRKHAVNGWEAKGSLDFIGVYGVQWGEGTGAPANTAPLNNLPAGSFYLDVATSDIYYKDNTLTWSNKGQLGGGGGGVTVVDNLTSTSSADALSAKQGKALYDALVNKLDTSAYVQHYRGKFSSLVALETAIPTGSDGNYAIVDTGTENDAVCYIWDAQDGWVSGGATTASTTDTVTEGSTNLYFTDERVRNTLLTTGLSLVTNAAISASDSVLGALGKLQKQITDILTNQRYVFVTDANTTYIVPASAITANGNTIIELSNNSLTSITVNTSTGTGKTSGDSVTIHITGTYAAQLLVADGVTLNGTLAFSANAKIKTLIYRGSNTWTVLGG